MIYNSAKAKREADGLCRRCKRKRGCVEICGKVGQVLAEPITEESASYRNRVTELGQEEGGVTLIFGNLHGPQGVYVEVCVTKKGCLAVAERYVADKPKLRLQQN